MAGAFGYGADTYAASLAMGELSLLPAVRRAAPDATIAADGFSCRHQIRDGTGRAPLHVARILRAGDDWRSRCPQLIAVVDQCREGCDQWRPPRRWTLPRATGRLQRRSAKPTTLPSAGRRRLGRETLWLSARHGGHPEVAARCRRRIVPHRACHRRFCRRLQAALRAALGHRLRTDAEDRGGAGRRLRRAAARAGPVRHRRPSRGLGDPRADLRAQRRARLCRHHPSVGAGCRRTARGHRLCTCRQGLAAGGAGHRGRGAHAAVRLAVQGAAEPADPLRSRRADSRPRLSRLSRRQVRDCPGVRRL